MEDFAGGLDCNLRISGMVADSIMMGIVHSAMEHAFDKACSKEGVLERLNDKSRFCELAVMQLDWCLKFVQEETDKFVMIESSCEREKLLNDLTETRDRIQRRLEETELAIWEKDREFSERLESDFKLREAVEMKDRQLSSLRSNFEYDRSKSDNWVVGADDGRDGDFCELKNSVDKQFFNIKQKLEDERINFTFGMRKMSIDLTNGMDGEPDLQQVDEENSNSHGECLVMDGEIGRPNQSLRRVFSTGFEKMGSDIDILKETLDAAFGIMSNAISLAEVGPMEQQWRWAVEKDVVFVVFKGFLKDIQGGHIPRIRDRNECNFQLSSGVDWSHLMDEIENLRNELDQLLVSHSEDRTKTVAPRDTVTSPPTVKNAATIKEIIFSKEKPPTDEADVSSTLNRSRSGSGKIDNVFPRVSDQDNPEEPAKENQAGQGSLVAEMIRNHECIIRQKSEELNWLKGEIIREKGSAVKKDKGHDTMKKRIQDLVARLDSVIEANKKLGTNDNDCRLAHENDSIRVSSREVSQLNEDQEDLNLKTLMMDDVNVVVLKNIIKDLHSNLHYGDRMQAIRDDVCKVFLRETVEDWKHEIASYDVESHLREEVFYFICSEALRDAHDGCTCKKYLVNRNEDNREETSSSNHTQNLESLIAEDVQTIILRETVREWENYLESSNIETVIREEVFYNVVCSAAKDIICSPSFISTERQNTSSNGISEEDLSLNDSKDENLESIIQGNVYMDFFREMVKEWNREVQNYNTDEWNSQSVSPFSDNMPQQLHARENGNLLRTLDSLSNCFEAEENLISLSSEMIKREAQIELFDERLVEVHHDGLLVMKDESLGSVVKNLELILQQISMSKLQLKELRSCLGFAVGDTKGGLDQMNSVVMTAEGQKDSPHLIAKENKAAEEPSVLSTLTIFSKAIVDFECMVQETMGLCLSRLEKLKHQLDSSVEHVTSLREQEVLYRKAFIMRCCNLQKAEAEVDLLADEQDDLLLLLEKIYIALDHYSPVLQHYFGIEEILKLIREELTGTATRFQ